MWKRIGCYGALLAAGTLGLQWLDYQHLARVYPADVYTFLIAIAFLALEVLIGARVIAVRPSRGFDGNPAARAALGISPSELRVLREIASGHSKRRSPRT